MQKEEQAKTTNNKKYLRSLSDAEAFQWLITNYPPNSDNKYSFEALTLVWHRSWKKKYFEKLARAYLTQTVPKEAYQFIIQIFLKFMPPDLIKSVLRDAAEGDAAKMDFAKYYFNIEVAKKYGVDAQRWQ